MVRRHSNRKSNRSLRAAGLAAGLALGVGLAPVAAHADEKTFWENVGGGVGAGFVNILYFPAKLIYATAGATVGGVAWLVTLGDPEAAQTVWSSTLGGTWVISPAMLEGQTPVEFNGRVPLTVGTAESSPATQAADPLDPNDPYSGSESWR